MNTYTTQIALPHHLTGAEDFFALYKIYVGIEKDRNNRITGVEIIDGYLKANEHMYLKSQTVLDQGICYLEIEIVPNQQLNTYLPVKLEAVDFKTVFVRTFRKNQCVGYQWIDLDGNVLNMPSKTRSKGQNYEVSF